MSVVRILLGVCLTLLVVSVISFTLAVYGYFGPFGKTGAVLFDVILTKADLIRSLSLFVVLGSGIVTFCFYIIYKILQKRKESSFG